MWRLSAQKRGGERSGSEGCARRRSSCESSAQPCRSEERYTDKTYTAEHPERGRRNESGVIELPPVVTLDGLNSEAELSGHPGKGVEEGGEGLSLGAQRESLRVMGKIINNDQVIFVARHAEYRRCPQVTVNKIKSMRSMRRRKRNSNMTT